MVQVGTLLGFVQRCFQLSGSLGAQPIRSAGIERRQRGCALMRRFGNKVRDARSSRGRRREMVDRIDQGVSLHAAGLSVLMGRRISWLAPRPHSRRTGQGATRRPRRRGEQGHCRGWHAQIDSGIGATGFMRHCRSRASGFPLHEFPPCLASGPTDGLLRLTRARSWPVLIIVKAPERG